MNAVLPTNDPAPLIAELRLAAPCESDMIGIGVVFRARRYKMSGEA
jgi:hypothetical protein